MSMIHISAIVAWNCKIRFLASNTLSRILIAEFTEKELSDPHPHISNRIFPYFIFKNNIICFKAAKMQEHFTRQIL